jgi:hypothetical protein
MGKFLSFDRVSTSISVSRRLMIVVCDMPWFDDEFYSKGRCALEAKVGLKRGRKQGVVASARDLI